MDQGTLAFSVDRPTTSNYLRQPWLTIARAIWVLFFINVLIVTVGLIPFNYNSYHHPLPDVLIGLNQLGISADLYSIYHTIFRFLYSGIFVAIAAIIFWRKSNDRLAIFVSLFLMCFGAVPVNTVLDSASITPPFLQLLVYCAGIVGWGSVFLFFCIFPDGHFAGYWTKWLAFAGFLFAILWFLPPEAPLQPSNWNLPALAGIMLLLGSFLLYAQIYRYRHVSTLLQRKQTKWLIWAFATAISLMIMIIVVSPSEETPVAHAITELIYPLTDSAFLLIPLALAFAIFRYRLWDIDFIINRSLVYGALTLLLLVVFGGVLYGISLLMQGQQSVFGVVVAAVAVTSLFQPARRRLQHFVDSRFYRIKIDYERNPQLTVKQMRPGLTIAPQDTPFGEYKNLELIGRGGMAQIYKSHHPRLNCPVAIKLLSVELALEEDFPIRFEREAEIVSKLQHPNIVRLFDYGKLEQTHFMVMEYIAGEDLERRLRNCARLALAEVAKIVGDVASALDYAHSQGLVHRDIKPSNIMLDKNGDRAVLTDFGVAKMLNRKTSLTQSGVLIGTLSYLSPEQIQDAPLDGRADIYALGVMVYQMLTGELPFKQGNMGALLIAHMTQPAPDPRSIVADLPLSVSAMIAHAMAKQPDDRYQKAGEFAQALSYHL